MSVRSWKLTIVSCLFSMYFCLLPASDAFAQDRTGDQIDVMVREEEKTAVGEEFTLRARVARITPSEPVNITWRYGGEGVGGKVVRGKLGEKLEVGQWSEAFAVADFKKGGRFPRRFYVTFEAGRKGRKDPKKREKGDWKTGKLDYSKDVELELEFSYKGKVVKTLKELGPEGGTITLHIPAYHLDMGKTPSDPEFLNDLVGVREIALRRAKMLESLEWANWATPKKYIVVTQVGGYGHGIGYGIRTTDIAVTEAECRSLHQLGVNTIRSPNGMLHEMIEEGEGFAKDFSRAMMLHAKGYPVPTFRKDREVPHAGCPYAPGISERQEKDIAESLRLLETKVSEVWALTVDEIGPVFGQSGDKLRHVALCPYCAEGFRDYLKQEGLTPQDFGKEDWSDIKPVDLWGPPKPRRGKGEQPAPSPQAVWTPPDLTDKYVALTAYNTLRFISYASARLFTPLRDAFDTANREKANALARGETETPVAKQPWVYTYALRGYGFVMRGYGLDYMGFYRHADNAMVYETSGRGPRVWGWDSYACDTGRMVSDKMRKMLGIYIKPHRGAPIQRALTAVARNARMLYWYTYGPVWAKGDCFSENPTHLSLTSKAAHLIGKTEDVLHGSSWVRPAEVAVVSPWSSVLWNTLTDRSEPVRLAAWENAKWVYSALQHAHIPVDPLDEVMLLDENLSRYKIIYVSGPNITRASAKVLEKYVRDGGTLYVSGWGMVRDEANQPLTDFQRVLGLDGRGDPEMYYKVKLYQADTMEMYDDSERVITPAPEGAKVLGGGAFRSALSPVVGREILKPSEGAEVLVKFGDGSPAVTRNKYGKGQVYVVGFFPGLEYSAPVRTEQFDMARDLTADRRSYVVAPALALTKPVVDCSEGMVEGVLLKNDQTGKPAVTLMNWGYRAATDARRRAAIIRFENLKVAIRPVGDVTKVTSAMLDKSLPVTREGDLIIVTLPVLEEGDVLLLD